MPHRCIRCGKDYSGDAMELIRGCGCGARIFLYMKKKEDLKKAGEMDWLQSELRKIDEKRTGAPVTIEIENVRMLEKGVFELDLASLIINRDPVVVKDSYGVYYVKLPEKKRSSVLKDG